jgi:dolichyl-phosphate beta-glucosyltransferase
VSGADRAPIDLSVVIPAYDAAEFIEKRLGALCDFLAASELRYEVIAVDDGSRDDTPERIHALGRAHVRLLRRPQNGGKFAAIASGMAECRGACCLFTDADVPYSLSAIPEMVHLVRERGFHLVIGDRTLPESSYGEHLGPVRALATRLFTAFVRLFVTGGLPDTQCGIKAFRGDVARSLFPLLRERGFAGDVELLYVALKYNLTIRRLPARLVFQGRSSVRPMRDGLAMLRAVLAIPGRYRAGAYASSALESLGRADHTRGDYQYRARREGNPVQRFWHAKKRPLVNAQLAPGPDDRVLDVGAGSSEISLEFSGRSALACAVDASVAPLRFMRELTGEDGRTHFIAADIHALPFHEASFDKISVLEVIEHLPSDGVSRYLNELRRLLAPGGRLFLTTPNYRSVWPVLEFLIDHLGGAAEMGGKQHITRFHARSLQAALEANGFHVLRRGSVYHLSPFLSLVAPALAERVFEWESRRGGNLGPILYAVAEAVEG